ncbi:hypothetical protein RND81_10G055700 [Saponaria officinalis]|uniref:Peptidase A1 domain-containing protein n=1 Tax=Saponaria officinalis TaxID=3572 RepID=A0AAW1HZB7_SAPOF
MKHHNHFTLTIFFLLHLTIGLGRHVTVQAQAQAQCKAQEDKDSTLQIIHISSPCSPMRPKTPMSWEQSVAQTQAQDRARLNYLTTLVVAHKSVAPVAWGRQLMQSPTYLVRVKIGTPPRTLFMALDTSSDAAWLPCSGCLGCSSSSHFAPNKSSSFKSLGCSTHQCQQVINPSCFQKLCTFNQTYGSSTIAATLSQDTLSLAQDLLPKYVFGCISKATGSSVPPQGLLGLGRGLLSLLSQTQTLYKSTFSYCLPNFRASNFSGQLRLGLVAQPQRGHYTPLLKNPRRSSLYYVNLVGIKVGRKTVDIPSSALAFDPTTGAGTIIDSGTVYTRLVLPAYTAVRDEFRRQMRTAIVTSLGGFDTCYTVPVTIPTITFMFQGLNMTLTQDSFLLHSVSTSTACLAMAAAPDNVNSVLNVIASMQQQNHRVVFDVPNSRVGISREPCS